MTSRPLENEVGPRHLSDEEIISGDFIASIKGSTSCRALVISDAAARQFYAFCPQCGERRPLHSAKVSAQLDADEHNEGNAP